MAWWLNSSDQSELSRAMQAKVEAMVRRQFNEAVKAINRFNEEDLEALRRDDALLRERLDRMEGQIADLHAILGQLIAKPRRKRAR